MENMIFESHSEEETRAFAEKIADKLKPSDVLCMYGDLGAGKTAFVKGIAEGLGIGEYITSPTFTIMNRYEGRLTLYHFDVYRISDSEELYEIGFDECIDGDGVCVIEWAQLVEDILPRERYSVIITKDESDFNYRKIEIRKELA